MKKLVKNQWGFSAVEGLLIILVIAVIGFVGWYVWNNKSKFKSSSTPTISSVTVKKKVAPSTSSAPADPTAGWTTYSSSDSKISFKYPKTWVTASHPELCGSGIFLLGANSSSVGACGTNNFGQISVTWQPMHAKCAALSSTATVEKVIVSGVSGIKQTNLVGSGTVEPKGSLDINYCFNTGGYTYVADYNQRSSYPNVQTDFNLMVMKTLKFSN